MVLPVCVIRLQVVGASENTLHKVLVSDVEQRFSLFPDWATDIILYTSGHVFEGINQKKVVWNQAQLIAEIPNLCDICFKML